MNPKLLSPVVVLPVVTVLLALVFGGVAGWISGSIAPVLLISLIAAVWLTFGYWIPEGSRRTGGARE